MTLQSSDVAQPEHAILLSPSGDFLDSIGLKQMQKDEAFL